MSSILYKIILKNKIARIALVQVLVVFLQAVIKFIMKYFVETRDKIHAEEVYCHNSNGVLSSDPNDSGVNSFINKYGILVFFEQSTSVTIQLFCIYLLSRLEKVKLVTSGLQVSFHLDLCLVRG